jgi:hypothetical protein
MLCPNCGTKTTKEHKFCRNCGMNLEPVSKALSAHLAQGGEESPPAEDNKRRRDLRRMTNGLITGVAIILIGVLLLSIAKQFSLRPSYKLLGIITMLAGMFVSFLAIVLPLRSAGQSGRPSTSDELEGARTTGRLLNENTIEPVPSITERTTDLLGVEIGTPHRE